VQLDTKEIEYVWLADGEKSLMLCLAVSSQYRRVTDGNTDRRTLRHADGQTSCDSIVRDMPIARVLKMRDGEFNLAHSVQCKSCFQIRTPVNCHKHL